MRTKRTHLFCSVPRGHICFAQFQGDTSVFVRTKRTHPNSPHLKILVEPALGYRQGMLYDGIAAESAHVSIDGRATASIIDEKKLPEWVASEAVFCQVSQLGEAGAGHSRTQWHASAQHLAASQNSIWWWVITHHQSFNFQLDGIRIGSFLRSKGKWHRKVPRAAQSGG